MTKKKITKIVLIVVAVALVAALGIGFYMFNKPHRNVQEAAVDFQTNATELVAEYLKDAQASNEKYFE